MSCYFTVTTQRSIRYEGYYNGDDDDWNILYVLIIITIIYMIVFITR